MTFSNSLDPHSIQFEPIYVSSIHSSMYSHCTSPDKCYRPLSVLVFRNRSKAREFFRLLKIFVALKVKYLAKKMIDTKPTWPGDGKLIIPSVTKKFSNPSLLWNREPPWKKICHLWHYIVYVGITAFCL